MSQPETSVEDVAPPLETITQRGYGARTVFRDWVTLMLTSLTGQEEVYDETVESYPNDRERGDREADLFAEAFGTLQSAIANLNRDVLGDVYEHLGLQNDENGQHFTPHPVCRMKVAMVIDDDAEAVTDPTCGSGRLLVEAGKQVPDAVFVGRDNDQLCAKMAALNMCFFNLDAVIIYGNSLKLTRRKAWQTTTTALGAQIREVTPEEVTHVEEVAFGDENEGQDESVDEGEATTEASAVSQQSGLEELLPATDSEGNTE